jgi:DNA-binding PadR family transcriptional regulator
MARESLGEFEQLVLLACLHLESNAYAVPIIEELEKRTGRIASHAAVYIALRRLEKKGLVDSYLAESTPERGGRAKRFFRVAPQAIELLRESREALLAMWQGLELTAK